jgi:hypothetical protein
MLMEMPESVNGPISSQKNRITYIVNGRYIPTTNQINKYRFSAYGKDSELRDLQLSTKLPDRYATAMYVGASAPGKTIENVVVDFFGDGAGSLQNENSAPPKSPEEPISFEEIYDLNAASFFATEYIVRRDKEARAKEAGLPERIKFDEETSTKEKILQYNLKNSTDRLGIIREVIAKDGLTEKIIKQLNGEMKTLSNDASKSWNRSIVLPIDATFTIDGVNGFRFGNVVDINYLPLRYQRKGIEFIVTKVEDTVQGSEWLTTVTLQCRVASSTNLPAEVTLPTVEITASRI